MSTPLTAVIALSCALVGAAGGAALHATMTGHVTVTCPAPAPASDNGAWLRTPVPPTTGNPGY